MSTTSAEARDLEGHLGFADGIMLAYKSSKAALNQRAPTAVHRSSGDETLPTGWT